MPVTPQAIPKTLYATLSKIRSTVFLSTHNPEGLRMGNKWLRKGLKGPGMLEYYPKPKPSAAQLNKSFEQRMDKMEAGYLKGAKGDKELKKRTEELDRWRLYAQVPPGYAALQPVPESPSASGIFFDEREHQRLEFVRERQRIGKGVPKKGEGRRTQMVGKKKKK